MRPAAPLSPTSDHRHSCNLCDVITHPTIPHQHFTSREPTNTITAQSHRYHKDVQTSPINSAVAGSSSGTKRHSPNDHTIHTLDRPRSPDSTKQKMLS